MQHAPATLDHASVARAVNFPAPAFRQESAQLHLDRFSPELRVAQLPDFPARKPSAHSRGRERSIERCNLFPWRAITAFLRAELEQLKENGICRDTMFIFATEPSQQPMIFAHRHGDAWPNPGHRTDGGNQTETNDSAGESPAVFAKNVFTCD